MALSIITNTGAMAALQNLNKTTKLLERTQLNVTTGLRVNGPKDDASSFSIAQRMRGEIAGIKAVKTALANGESISNTAITAGLAIADLLTEMKAKVVQANQAGLDSQSRSALHTDFIALRNQLDTIVQTAEFNGTNLIESGASTLTVLSTVDGSTISVSAQNLSATGGQPGCPRAASLTGEVVVAPALARVVFGVTESRSHAVEASSGHFVTS